jgi:hypothetical protein
MTPQTADAPDPRRERQLAPICILIMVLWGTAALVYLMSHR